MSHSQDLGSEEDEIHILGNFGYQEPPIGMGSCLENSTSAAARQEHLVVRAFLSLVGVVSLAANPMGHLSSQRWSQSELIFRT